MKITGHPPMDTIQSASGPGSSKEAKLKTACQDFEAIMLKQMLTSMRESTPKGGLFETSHAEQIFLSMHDEEIAKGMAHGKGMGLGDLLFQKIEEHHKDKI